MGNLDFSANADQLKELATFMASQINVPTIGIGGGYAPLGTINFFDATVAPQDWLACDGSVYNIADYPQLAEWYATQHGASNFYGGDGTTTFAVPDLQGEFLRGTGTNSHTNQGSGAALGVHQDATVFPNLYANVASNKIWVGMGTDSFTGISDYDSSISKSIYSGAISATYSTGPGNDNMTSRPTNTSFLICVKAVVAGEVYSTEERVVGTWIDGKKIYQKTVAVSSFTATQNGTEVTLVSSGIESLIFASGEIIDAGGYHLTIPSLNSTSGPINNYLCVNLYSNRIYLFARCIGSTKAFNGGTITVQYTKTV